MATYRTIRVRGIDALALGGRYEEVLSTAFRSDADMLVICKPTMTEREFTFARMGVESGHAILLAPNRDFAPAETVWLDQIIL